MSNLPDLKSSLQTLEVWDSSMHKVFEMLLSYIFIP